jgi:hypothetical protein
LVFVSLALRPNFILGFRSEDSGVVIGVGKGLVGAFTKPILGFTELVAHTTGGILHTTSLSYLPARRLISTCATLHHPPTPLAARHHPTPLAARHHPTPLAARHHPTPLAARHHPTPLDTILRRSTPSYAILYLMPSYATLRHPTPSY